MKDLGDSRNCLGIEISRNRTHKPLILAQKSNIEKVLKRFEMTECKPVVTALDQFPSKQNLKDSPVDSTTYR